MSLDPASVFSLERPHSKLLTYYVLSSLLLGPFFLFLLVPRYLRYLTLRYHFDEEGISMRWGVLFHREISLTYSRIQDIHLASNVLERWLGLARVKVQTASGAAAAEMVIEGLEEFELVRDFLYIRMRGVKGASDGTGPQASHRPRPRSPEPAAGTEELTRVLVEVADELRAVRSLLERRHSEVRQEVGHDE